MQQQKISSYTYRNTVQVTDGNNIQNSSTTVEYKYGDRERKSGNDRER